MVWNCRGHHGSFIDAIIDAASAMATTVIPRITPIINTSKLERKKSNKPVDATASGFLVEPWVSTAAASPLTFDKHRIKKSPNCYSSVHSSATISFRRSIQNCPGYGCDWASGLERAGNEAMEFRRDRNGMNE